MGEDITTTSIDERIDFSKYKQKTLENSGLYKREYKITQQIDKAVSFILRGDNPLGLQFKKHRHESNIYILHTSCGIILEAREAGEVREENRLVIYWDGHTPVQITQVVDFLSQRLPGLEQLKSSNLEQLLPQH